jgi:hypothetical protein
MDSFWSDPFLEGTLALVIYKHVSTISNEVANPEHHIHRRFLLNSYFLKGYIPPPKSNLSSRTEGILTKTWVALYYWATVLARQWCQASILLVCLNQIF